MSQSPHTRLLEPRGHNESDVDFLARLMGHHFDSVRDDLRDLNDKVDDHTTRLTRIENLVLTWHDNRLAELEDHVRQLAIKVGLEFHR
ncbi:MAG: hypothetical protein KatS3mg104_1812 [Phycisphaerae bacterium]|nr:MAG: hypothetical protein KatS3mg104_1812 [Phycisphaerae bacterium]